VFVIPYLDQVDLDLLVFLEFPVHLEFLVVPEVQLVLDDLVLQ
jgi:hypothetical protein